MTLNAVIECEKGTKERYEKGKDGKLSFKGNVKRSWIEAYGFIENTLQADGDELDTYIIGRKLKRGDQKKVFPIMLIVCKDNGRQDNKLVCTTSERRKVSKLLLTKLVRAVEKYKKGSKVFNVELNDTHIAYEVAKCKALRAHFEEGLV